METFFFLYQVISHKALPFLIKAPNKETREAMIAARNGKGLERVSLEELSDEWEDECERASGKINLTRTSKRFLARRLFP